MHRGPVDFCHGSKTQIRLCLQWAFCVELHTIELRCSLLFCSPSPVTYRQGYCDAWVCLPSTRLGFRYLIQKQCLRYFYASNVYAATAALCVCIVTLSRTQTVFLLKIINRSFRYASPRLWNKLPRPVW